MLGLTNGELFIVVFVVVAVLTASWWPRMGEAVAEMLAGRPEAGPESDED